jgi:hypothetical protein
MTHESYSKVTRSLIVRHGFAPSVVDLLSDATTADEFVTAAALPDLVNELACQVPGLGPQTSMLGHNLASLEHFQRADGRGYYWPGDESLTVAGRLVETAAAVAQAHVTVNHTGEPAPLVPMLDPPPVVASVASQPSATVCSCDFPSAALGAAYYGEAARQWAAQGNTAGWRRCAGYALHFVQDCLVPHHAWGCLLYGHAAFEDELEARWARTLTDTVEAGLVGSQLAHAVWRELHPLDGATSLDALCQSLAMATRAHFGGPTNLAECSGDVALAVSVRAVAASVRACELMTTS